jgi:CheY-like chemotaxis protein
MMVEDMLTEMGHEIVAMAGRIPQALEIARTGVFDLAILDLNLDGEPSYPVAALLRDRGIPFVLATGYGKTGVAPDFSDALILPKPFIRADLEKILRHTSEGP